MRPNAPAKRRTRQQVRAGVREKEREGLRAACETLRVQGSRLHEEFTAVRQRADRRRSREVIARLSQHATALAAYFERLAAFHKHHQPRLMLRPS